MTPLLLALIFWTAADTLTGKVVKIADGDTVTILVGGNQVRIRLFGIDAPERGQDYSRKSSDALAGLVFGKARLGIMHDIQSPSTMPNLNGKHGKRRRDCGLESRRFRRGIIGLRRGLGSKGGVA